METVGAVFTPALGGRFAVSRAKLVERWLAGATILDPTMGDGGLLAALVESALYAGHPLSALPFDRLWGVELVPRFHASALERFQRDFGVSMQTNFRCADFFETPPIRCTILLGNPPWVHYTDLPETWKPRYRSYFVHYGLVPDARQTLLGRSRIDLAALVVQKALLECLEDGGEAWFFLPLSLFLNDGAHTAFRQYRTSGVPFAPLEIWDFQSEPLFSDVSTHYALVRFGRNCEPQFPVPYHTKEPEGWRERRAAPGLRPDDPLSVLEQGEVPLWSRRRPIRVSEPPRQGVNTGGANEVFFFRRCEALGEVVRVDGSVLLPRHYVHPLITARLFRDPESSPEKWVLIPHGNDGRPLGLEAVQKEPLLFQYLSTHEARLRGRRGGLVGSWVTRGRWWALLGVGPYCFAPFKIVWEAYGRRQFRPMVVPGHWQANQSLQAYLPCTTEDQALSLLAQLTEPAVQAYLESFRTGGTMSWAQPGKVLRLLAVVEKGC